MEATFTKFLLLCKSSNKLVPKCKFLDFNNKAILTSWPVINK